MKSPLRFIQNYPQETLDTVQKLLDSGQLRASIEKRFPKKNTITSDKALYTYVMELKNQYLRSSPPIARVLFDKKISIENQALGLHSTKSRVQGSKLKSKSEIRIAEIFRKAPEAFFRVIVVHELAHLKEKNHDKPFYKLCIHMEPDYYQLEFDMRLWLVDQEFNK